MSDDNAFGIRPEQKMVNLGYATKLSASELREQELRDRKHAEADREKARDDSLLAQDRHSTNATRVWRQE